MILYMALGLLLLSNTLYAVEYVKICTTLGPNDVQMPAGYFVIPGSASTDVSAVCIQPSTGITQTGYNDGTIVTGQSELAYRVSQLERQLTLLLADTEEN